MLDFFNTIDAKGTQTKIMDKIIEKGGHFCLQLKPNQPMAFKDVSEFFTNMEKNWPSEFDTLDSRMETQKDHGRIERRTYSVFSDVKDIKMLLDPQGKHVKCIGMTRWRRQIGDKISEEVHFHLLDMVVNAEKYGQLARGHLAIENSLHWVLGIYFKEDSSTANADFAISNLSLLRRIAFNFTKLDPEMKKTTKKKMIDYMTDPFLFNKLVYEIIPQSVSDLTVME